MANIKMTYMKRLLSSVLLPAALAIVIGCEEIKPDSQEQKTFRLTVSMPDVSEQQPRTHIERLGDVFRTYWSIGDDISINGHISSPVVSDGEHSTEFVFNGYSPLDGEIMNILHPGVSGTSFIIPAEQNFAEGRYPSAAAPMWSSAVKGTDVTMNHLCSILSLNFHGEGSISKVELTATGGEHIAGEFQMGFSDGAYSGAVTGGSGSQITITFVPAVALASDKVATLNIPVLAGRYTKGFTAKIYNSEGKFQRIKIYSAGKVLDPLKVYERPDDIFNPVENSGSLGDMDENIIIDNRILTVGTYNILASSARAEAGENTWDAARETIAGIISDMNCDVMTLNELYSTEIDYLQGALAGYEWVLHHNLDNTYTFAPGIIYNPVRLEKLSDGIFWLSDPEATSLKTTQGCYSYEDRNFETAGFIPDIYKAGEHRCCVWARFRDKVTGYSFCYFAPHAETRGADAASPKTGTSDCLNAGNIRSLAAQVPLVNTEGLPLLVAGDMNTNSGHVSYQVFDDSGWTDSFNAASAAKCLDADTWKEPGTDIGLGPDYVRTEARRIDFVLYDGFEVCSYSNIFTRYNGGYPSDHLPVKVKLSFSNL